MYSVGVFGWTFSSNIVNENIMTFISPELEWYGVNRIGGGASKELNYIDLV